MCTGVCTGGSSRSFLPSLPHLLGSATTGNRVRVYRCTGGQVGVIFPSLVTIPARLCHNQHARAPLHRWELSLFPHSRQALQQATRVRVHRNTCCSPLSFLPSPCPERLCNKRATSTHNGVYRYTDHWLLTPSQPRRSYQGDRRQSSFLPVPTPVKGGYSADTENEAAKLTFFFFFFFLFFF